MTKAKKVEWDPQLSVDIEEIDLCQRKMFDLFNQLFEIKNEQKESKDCINMLSEINEFSRQYFGTEERLLKKHKYPDLTAHIKSHRQFTKTTVSLRREISDDLEKLTDEAIDDMRNWLVDHIKTFDALYVPFVRIKKYIEASR